MRFKIFLLISIILYSNYLCAQLTIFGNVTDEKNVPLEFVTVSLTSEQEKLVSLTDNTGKFKMQKLLSDHYTITFSYIGFTSDSIHFILTKDTVINVQLRPLQHQLKNVTVVSRKPFIERKIDKIVMNIENNALTSGMSSAEVLSIAPGVRISNDGIIQINGVSGGSIMLNDHMVYLKGTQLMGFLNGLRAEDIKSIEIIPRPPADFDAEGAGGIIKIITRKKRSDGIETNLNTTYRQGVYPKLDKVAGVNYKQKRLVFFGSYNHNNRKGFYNRRDKRNIDGNPYSFTNDVNYIGYSYADGYRAGFIYDISPKHFIGFEMVGASSYFQTSSAILNTNIFYNKLLDSIIRGNYPLNSTDRNASYNFNYKWNIDTIGRNVKLLADYAFVNSLSSDLNENSYFDKNEIFFRQVNRRSNVGDSIKIFSTQADLDYPLQDKKSDLRSGIKFSWVNNRNSNAFDLYNFTSQQWMVDASQTNHFKYHEKIFAAYINFSSKLKKLEYMAGLRLENTQSESISTTTNISHTNIYTKLFPNVFVKYPFNENNNQFISFSYTRRITRPQYTLLNPFVYLLNQFTIKKGNPYLQPAISQALSVTYSFTKSLAASANYSFTKDALSDVNLNQGNYNIETFGNLSSSQSLSFGVNYSHEITKWWSTFNDIRYQYNLFKDPYFSQNYSGINLNTNNNIIINPKLNFQFSFSFSTKGYDRYYKHNLNFAFANAAFQQKIWKDKLLLGTGINDIFYRQGNLNLYMNYQGQQINTWVKRDTRQFFISLKYQFKKGLDATEKKLDKSNVDEMNRAK